MTKLLSLLTVGMFVRDSEKVDGKWVPKYRVVVAEAARALQRLLNDGQCLVEDFYHNASWYNKLGEKLGWGDLNRAMLTAVQKALPAGEVFVACYESASFWEIKRDNPDIDPTRPGVDWLVKNAAIVITPCGLYVPPGKYDEDRWVHMEKINLRGDHNLPAYKVNREWVKNLLDTAGRMECSMEGETKFIVTPVENPPLVEELLPHPWSVGDNWTCSLPEQEQADGRWKLYVYDVVNTTPPEVVEVQP